MSLSFNDDISMAHFYISLENFVRVVEHPSGGLKEYSENRSLFDVIHEEN